MNYVVVVERSGQQQIQKVSLCLEQQVVVGRAWQNTIVVNDEYIDASHLRFSVNEDGVISVADMNTKNGTRLNKRTLTGEVYYTVGERMTIGESSVALYEMQTTVTPALKHDAVHTVSRVFGSLFWGFIATLGLGAGLLASAYWQSPAEATSEVLVLSILGFGVGAFVWSLLAGVIGKLFRNETYVMLHWILLCILAILTTIFTFLTDILRFNLDTDLSNVVLENGVYVCFLALFAYGTFSLSTRMGRARKLTFACVLALLPVVFSLITPMLAEEHETWSYATSVKRINQPPALFFRTPITLETHIRKTDALFAKLEAQVNAGESTTLGIINLIDNIEGPVQFTAMD